MDCGSTWYRSGPCIPSRHRRSVVETALPTLLQVLLLLEPELLDQQLLIRLNKEGTMAQGLPGASQLQNVPTLAESRFPLEADAAVGLGRAAALGGSSEAVPKVVGADFGNSGAWAEAGCSEEVAVHENGWGGDTCLAFQADPDPSASGQPLVGVGGYYSAQRKAA